MNDFHRMTLLPQYIFNNLADLKNQARAAGKDIFDFGMGNPDQPTPAHIVEALIEAAKEPANHRYSLSNGIDELRQAICEWYQSQYSVDVNWQKEAVVTIGSKEGIAHLALAMISPGDIALVPSPAYPIHTYAFIIAGGQVKHVSLQENLDDFLKTLTGNMEGPTARPKIMVLNFPSNPTAQCVDVTFFEEVVAIAKRYKVWVLHDLAYADIVFDGYKAPSILQVKGAKDVAVESYTLSKGYNMPGWRVGFMCGNERLVAALTKMKSYLDYGMFAPIQVAAIAALSQSQESVEQIRMTYQRRRDVLCTGLKEYGWEFSVPQASMFVWAKIPKTYREFGSLEFAKQLLLQSGISVSPGIAFGVEGNEYVRFSLIESEERTRAALIEMKRMLFAEQLIVT